MPVGCPSPEPRLLLVVCRWAAVGYERGGKTSRIQQVAAQEQVAECMSQVCRFRLVQRGRALQLFYWWIGRSMAATGPDYASGVCLGTGTLQESNKQGEALLDLSFREMVLASTCTEAPQRVQSIAAARPQRMKNPTIVSPFRHELRPPNQNLTHVSS